MALWNHRMFLLTRQTRYADVLELEVYNNVPAGVSLSGDKFFYDNPLASDGSHERVPWFDCSCCPTNVVRFLPAMGERIYAALGRDLHVILYAASTADVEVGGTDVRVVQETDFPRSGTVRIAFVPKEPVRFALHLRVPAWCAQAAVDPAQVATRRRTPSSDEFVIDRTWSKGDAVVLEFEMAPRRLRADPAVEADRGRVALARGPLVYAVEAVDHAGHARDLALPADAKLSERWDPVLLRGTTLLQAPGARAFAPDPLHRSARPVDLVAIPYCLWANRGRGEMAVWIPEDANAAELPGAGPHAIQNGVLLGASHCWRTDTLLALNDGRVPAASGDESIPRLTFWDHRGTKEWIDAEFASPRAVHAVRVYWFDDEGRGNCRVPASARVLVRVGATWRAVVEKLPLVKDGWSAASFPAVDAEAVRVEAELRPGFSAGVLEWQIE